MATVASIFQYQVTPGKEAEFWALMNEAIPLFEANGASVRMFLNAVAGPNSDTAAFVAEYDNGAAYGAALDNAAANPAFAALIAKFAAGGVGTLLSRSIATEVARS